MNDTVLLMILENLVFGLVVGVLLVIANYFVTKQLENYKATASYQVALSNKKIEVYQVLWGKIFDYGNKFIALFDQRTESTGKAYLKAVDAMQEEIKKVGVFLGRNRMEVMLDGLLLSARANQKVLDSLKLNNQDQHQAIRKNFIDEWLQVLKDLERDIETGPKSKDGAS